MKAAMQVFIRYEDGTGGPIKTIYGELVSHTDHIITVIDQANELVTIYRPITMVMPNESKEP